MTPEHLEPLLLRILRRPGGPCEPDKLGDLPFNTQAVLAGARYLAWCLLDARDMEAAPIVDAITVARRGGVFVRPKPTEATNA